MPTHNSKPPTPRTDLDFLLDEQTPPPQTTIDLDGGNKVTGSLKSLIALLIAVLGIAGTYYGFKGSVARAEEGVAAADKKITTVDNKVDTLASKVADHEIAIKLANQRADAIEKDLDRRFQEVKNEQVASEGRIMRALSEIKSEIRKGR